MPPIKIEATDANGDKNRLSDLGPGLPYIFRDGNDALVVTCNLEDNGGIVTRSAGAQSSIVLVETDTGFDEYTALPEVGDIEAIIDEGGTHEMNIQTTAGMVAVMFTHFREG